MQQDVEMAKAVLEVMEEASKRISKENLNPFKIQSGEILPSNLERSFSGFLVRKDVLTLRVDTPKLLARIALLKDQILIAKFVGLA